MSAQFPTLPHSPLLRLPQTVWLLLSHTLHNIHLVVRNLAWSVNVSSCHGDLEVQ
jgi:hypothetical protein